MQILPWKQTDQVVCTRQDQVEMKENTRDLRLPGSTTGILVKLSLLEFSNTPNNNLIFWVQL